jgi:hypothetical protein
MTRLFLLIVLGVVVTYYFPDSRTMLIEKTQPLWVPVVKWDVKEEMKQVGRDVAKYEVNTGRLPQRRRWLEWLKYRYAANELTRDAWGNTYELRVWADSVGIVSYGPDRTKNTDDDFVVTTPRDRSRRRR